MSKINLKITLLVLLHLFVFNLFFTYRFTPYESLKTLNEWQKTHHALPLKNYLKLFLSNITDETYYYEWSTLVLGKNFEENFPFDSRKESPASKYFHQTPRLQMPYRDIPFEYPPLMAVLIILIRSITDTSLAFVKVLALVLSMFYLGSLWLCEKIRHQLKLPITSEKLLLLSLLSILTLGSLFITRLDVIPAFFYILAVWGLLNKNTFKGIAGIFLGFFSKGFTIILIPLFGIEWLRQKKYKSLALGSIILLTATGLTMVILQKISMGHYLESFKYHAERGIQIESFYALAPWLCFLGHFKAICLYTDHGARSICLPHNSYLLGFSKIFPILIFSGIYARVLWIKSELESKKLFEISFILLFSFLITFKVFSPQFLIWFIPLIFLTPLVEIKFFSPLWFAMLLITQILYPHCYSFLTERPQTWSVGLLIARNCIVLLFWLTSLTWLWRKTSLSFNSSLE